MLSRWDVASGSDAHIPPDASGLGAIFREYDFKAAFTVVPRLLPGSLPVVTIILRRDDLSTLPGIGTIAVKIQRRVVLLLVFDLGDVPLSS